MASPLLISKLLIFFMTMNCRVEQKAPSLRHHRANFSAAFQSSKGEKSAFVWPHRVSTLSFFLFSFSFSFFFGNRSTVGSSVADQDNLQKNCNGHHPFRPATLSCRSCFLDGSIFCIFCLYHVQITLGSTVSG